MSAPRDRQAMIRGFYKAAGIPHQASYTEAEILNADPQQRREILAKANRAQRRALKQSKHKEHFHG